MLEISLITLNKNFLNLVNNYYLYVEELNSVFSSATVDFHDMSIIFSSPFTDSLKTRAIKCIYQKNIDKKHIHTIYLRTFSNELLTIKLVAKTKLDGFINDYI